MLSTFIAPSSNTSSDETWGSEGGRNKATRKMKPGKLPWGMIANIRAIFLMFLFYLRRHQDSWRWWTGRGGPSISWTACREGGTTLAAALQCGRNIRISLSPWPKTNSPMELFPVSHTKMPDEFHSHVLLGANNVSIKNILQLTQVLRGEPYAEGIGIFWRHS